MNKMIDGSGCHKFYTVAEQHWIRTALLFLWIFSGSVRAGICPYGWIDFSSSPSCYLFTDYRVRYTFDFSTNQCRSFEGELVTIGSKTEMDWITRQVRKLSEPSIPPKMAWWVGLQDPGQDQGMKYLNGSDADLKLFSWAGGKPPSPSQRRKCAAFVNGTMSVYECSSWLGLICERSKALPVSCETENEWVHINGSCLKYFVQRRDWAGARATCQRYDADLTTLQSVEEMTYVWDKSKLLLFSSWVGFKSDYRTRKYRWVGGNTLFIKRIPWWSRTNTSQPYDLSQLKQGDPDYCGYVQGYQTRRYSSLKTDKCSTKNFFTCSKPAAACADGWILHQAVCIKFFPQYQFPWYAAMSYCQALGGDLITIPSQSYQDLINEYLSDLNADGVKTFWIGLQDSTWVDKTRVGNWSNWARPPNDTGRYGYIRTRDAEGKWQQTGIYNTRRSFGCSISGHKVVKEAPPPPSPQGDCETGWDAAGDFCVYIGDRDVTWYTAEQNCKAMSSHLVMITNSSDQDFFDNRMKAGEYWIGLHDRQQEGKFSWIDGTQLNFTNWKRGQPDNKTEDENCVLLRGSSRGAKWEDRACNESRSYICQKELAKNGTSNIPLSTTPVPYSAKCGMMWEERPGTDVCYQFRDTQLSWLDALDVCKYYNGSLVSITSKEEESYIEARLHSLSSLTVWIGLSDIHIEAGWRWEDGSPLAYLNWNPGEPNDIANEDCATIVVGKMRWYDHDCSHRSGFVCKKMADSAVTPKPMFTTPTSIPDGKRYRCETGWLDSGYSCYKIRRLSSTWKEAQMACRQEGAELSSIPSEGENRFIGIQLRAASAGCENLHSNDSQCDDWAQSGECHINPGWMTLNCQSSCSLCKQSCEDKHTHIECQYWASSGECTKNADWMWPNCRLSCGCDKTINEGFWIGLNDLQVPMTFVWSDFTPVTYTPWMLNEPSNFNGNSENCVKMHALTSAWSTEPCEQTSSGYVCKKSKAVMDEPTNSPNQVGCPINAFGYGYKCYVIFDTQKTWADARSSCSSKKANLVTITDGVVASYIASQLVGKTSSYWTGLSNRDGTYSWVSGAKVVYLQWAPSHTGNENNTCVSIRSQLPIGLLENTRCQTQQPYICELDRKGVTSPTTTITTTPTMPAPCPSSWSEHGDRCYQMFFDTKTWKDAQAYCERFGGSLASVHSDTTAEFLARLAGYKVNGGFWIGLSDFDKEASFQWSDWSTFNYSKWANNEPNNATSAEDCVEASSSRWNSRWNDINCYVSRAFVCFIVRGVPMPTIPTTVAPTPGPRCQDKDWVFSQGYCYYISPDFGTDSSLTWFESRRKCLSMGGDLVSIRSEDENNFLTSVLSVRQKSQFWIGFNQLAEDSYSWSDGSPPIFVAWERNEPNDAFGGQRCVDFNADGGVWVDDDCMDDMGYVCKKLNDSTGAQVPVPTPIFHGVCPEGFLSEGVTNKCYYVGGRGNTSDPKLAWLDAREACRNLSSPNRVDLGSINSQIDQDFVTMLLAQLNSDLWIGFNDRHRSNTYVWQDDSEVTFTNWASDRPGHHYAQDRCVEMLRNPHKTENTAKWKDSSCSTRNAYLCQTMKEPVPTASTSTSTAASVSSSPRCPPNFFLYKSTCYSVINQPKSWSEAKKSCQFFSGDLASTLDIFEVARLDLAMYNHHIRQGAWIGMKFDQDSHQYKWSDRWPVDNTYWAVNEPDLQTNNSCVTLVKGSWNDTLCSELLPYICEVKSESPPTPTPTSPGHCTNPDYPTYGGYCYLAKPDDRVSWPEASYKCGQLGMMLVSIHSEGEDKFLEELVNSVSTSSRSSTNTWIGLHKGLEGGFRWSDKTEDNYFNWNEGEPTSVLQSDFADENCVEMFHDTGKWNDVPCIGGRNLGYICKVGKILPTTTTTTMTEKPNQPPVTTNMVVPVSNTSPHDEGKQHHLPSIHKPGGDKKGGSLTGGQIAGIVIGILGFAIIVGAVVFVIKRRSSPDKFALGQTGMSGSSTGISNALYVHSGNSEAGEDEGQVQLGHSNGSLQGLDAIHGESQS